MATVEITSIPVKKPVKVNEQKVFLELSLEEAQALANVTYRIGGCTRTSSRKHTDSIARALMSVGYYGQHVKISTECSSIYFEDTIVEKE